MVYLSIRFNLFILNISHKRNLYLTQNGRGYKKISVTVLSSRMSMNNTGMTKNQLCKKESKNNECV